MRLCIQITNFSYYDCDNMCTISYYHNRIGNMTHLPFFRRWSWNNGMRCMPFYILLSQAIDWEIHHDLVWIVNVNSQVWCLVPWRDNTRGTVWQLRRYLPSTVLSRWRKRRSVSDQFSTIVAVWRARGIGSLCTGVRKVRGNVSEYWYSRVKP